MGSNRLSAATRISIGLAGLTLTVLLAAHHLGFVPDTTRAALETRKALCESLAVSCALAAEREDAAALEAILEAAVHRNRDVLSAALTDAEGHDLVQAGRHQAHRRDLPEGRSTETQAVIPIYRGATLWGRLEICFRESAAGRPLAWVGTPVLGLGAFLFLAGFLVYMLYLRRTLQHLDPSSVIPDRVKAVLNVMSEGVLVLDRQERIVLANDVFAGLMDTTPEGLQGRRLTAFPWALPGTDGAPQEWPWTRTLQDGSTQRSVALGLPGAGGVGPRTFMINVTPILGAEGARRGALVTFDDVTSVEQMNLRLREALAELERSRDEVRRQNRTLEVLATQDPLTECLNRRSFFERFDVEWRSALRYRHTLACLMIDLDHFKRINDLYGHRVGDTVLQQMAEVLKSSLRATDFVCRYGGEEFCIVMPHTDADEAAIVADRLRRQVESRDCCGIPAAISLGVSATGLGAREPRELLDQADRALYVAKRTGRNRAVRWDHVPEDLALESASGSYISPPVEAASEVPIPFPAVACLLSALAHRDLATARHCRRVADLCVAVARSRMTPGECYVLKVAALLHDIGKLGVPDHILLKPGPLTEDEWKVMRTHDQMGVRIVSAAFASGELTRILEASHAWYGGSPRNPDLPRGSDIPISARALGIADAFDAMTTDRVYRKAMTLDQAADELRRCAGTQFDPDLVEVFLEAIYSRARETRDAASLLPTVAAIGMDADVRDLASAAARDDVPAILAASERLCETASAQGILPVAEAAAALRRLATEADPDGPAVARLAEDLLDACRALPTAPAEATPEVSLVG